MNTSATRLGDNMTLPPNTYCKHCGYFSDHHRAKDGRCPAKREFPRMTKLPANASLERVELAELAWDKRIAAHWSKRTTTFEAQP